MNLKSLKASELVKILQKKIAEDGTKTAALEIG